jgi:ribosome-associated protein
VHGHAVAEGPDAELAHQREVFAPASVVAAPLHLIHTQGALPDGWGAVLDAGGEHEKWAGGGTSVGHTQQECKDGTQARGGELGSRIRTEMIDITDELAIDERELEERFIRASGPGGQNVNKVSTAVQLRFEIDPSSLPLEVKTRLRRLGGKRVTADGVLVIDSREHRTQAQNREAARARLVALLQRAAHRPKSRHRTRPTARAHERRIQSKKKRGEIKEARRPAADE